jgi:hypothetical protein
VQVVRLEAAPWLLLIILYGVAYLVAQLIFVAYPWYPALPLLASVEEAAAVSILGPTPLCRSALRPTRLHENCTGQIDCIVLSMPTPTSANDIIMCTRRRRASHPSTARHREALG